MGWQNRIVDHGEEDPEQLLAHPLNWRIHPAFQQDALEGALQEIGWLSEVIVNRRSSPLWPDSERGVETVLDGHLRVKLALRRGQERIPVKYVDLTPQEEALALATFDPLSALAIADAQKLDAVLAEAQAEDGALKRLLVDLEQLAAEEMKKAKGLPDGEAATGETVSFRVTVPNNLAAETMAVLDTLKPRGLKWQRVREGV